jgi:hypothetical protein
MNEPPGLPSALGIEAVEWLGQGSDSLTVRVRGRWRRRRPTWSGQPLLVIETDGNRHRFPAMPEPPSLTGAAPGTWQMSFTVPASVLGTGGIRAWLQLGSVVVPLPVPVDSPEGDRVADEQTLAQRRIRAAELAAEAAARRAAEAEAGARELGARTEALEREVDRLNATIVVREKALRASEQRAHAERARRMELEEQLSSHGGREAVEEEQRIEELEARIEELEDELERLRRSLVEAEQTARIAVAARRRAEDELAALSAPREPAGAAGVAAGERLAAEFDTAAHSAPAVIRARAEVAVPEDAERLRFERELARARAGGAPPSADVDALRRELETRIRAETELRGELASLRGSVASDRPSSAAAVSETLAELREELGRLGGALQRERAGRELAEQRVAQAYDAIQEIRDELDQMRGSTGTEAPASQVLETGPAQPAVSVEAERLSAALSRLRARTSPIEAEPEASAVQRTDWLWRALRVLAREDSETAAHVIGAMLPGTGAQHALELSRIAAAGPVRRRLRRARLRRRHTVLMELAELRRSSGPFAAMRIDPGAALNLAAAMIDPAWVGPERFTVAYNGGPYLNVRGPDRPLVSETPMMPVTVSIVCGPRVLSAVLMGARPAGTTIYGELRQLELLQEWLERAQSG